MMKRIKKRALELNLPANRSAFLWGPRKTGKTYWIKRSVIVSLEKQLRKLDSSVEWRFYHGKSFWKNYGQGVSSQKIRAVLEKSPSIPLCKRGKQSECPDLLRCYVRGIRGVN